MRGQRPGSSSSSPLGPFALNVANLDNTLGASPDSHRSALPRGRLSGKKAPGNGRESQHFYWQGSLSGARPGSSGSDYLGLSVRLHASSRWLLQSSRQFCGPLWVGWPSDSVLGCLSWPSRERPLAHGPAGWPGKDPGWKFRQGLEWPGMRGPARWFPASLCCVVWAPSVTGCLLGSGRGGLRGRLGC